MEMVWEGRSIQTEIFIKASSDNLGTMERENISMQTAIAMKDLSKEEFVKVKELFSISMETTTRVSLRRT